MSGFRPQDKDTICALATPPGEGALALIRVSGTSSFSLVRQIAPFLPKQIRSHHVYFGTLIDPVTKQHVDEVLVSCFKKGSSFTGEESVEISCHGGVFLSSMVLDILIQIGGRLATKGEFSYRAFMNNKLDLVQAESVLHLIQSRSPKAHTQALKGLKGKLSHRLKKLEDSLIQFLSHLEASIDFSDQDIELDSLSQQKQQLKKIKQEVQKWLSGFKQGRINREGFEVLLLGAVNAGKSSLFNYLIQEDKAIVTHYPGTTRDILSARLVLKGREFCVKDTAGFREKPDLIEKKGIEKLFQEMKTADLCVFLIESKQPLDEKSFFNLEKINPHKLLLVFSKSDQVSSIEEKEKIVAQAKHIISSLKLSPPCWVKNPQVLWLSSRTGEGTACLKDILYEKSDAGKEDIFLSSSRQLMALRKIDGFLDTTYQLLEKKASPELMAFEIQLAVQVLYQLLGKEYNEQVIEQIFKEFCLGK